MFPDTFTTILLLHIVRLVSLFFFLSLRVVISLFLPSISFIAQSGVV